MSMRNSADIIVVKMNTVEKILRSSNDKTELLKALFDVTNILSHINKVIGKYKVDIKSDILEGCIISVLNSEEYKTQSSLSKFCSKVAGALQILCDLVKLVASPPNPITKSTIALKVHRLVDHLTQMKTGIKKDNIVELCLE